MINFETYSGYKARAVSPRTALVLWFMNMSENVARRKIIEFHFADEPELFFSQIASCIERVYNTQVTLNSSLSHNTQCIQLLQFLKHRGNIRKLRINYEAIE